MLEYPRAKHSPCLSACPGADCFLYLLVRIFIPELSMGNLVRRVLFIIRCVLPHVTAPDYADENWGSQDPY